VAHAVARQEGDLLPIDAAHVYQGRPVLGVDHLLLERYARDAVYTRSADDG